MLENKCYPNMDKHNGSAFTVVNMNRITGRPIYFENSDKILMKFDNECVYRTIIGNRR